MVVDIEEVKKWARAGATQEEIASRLGIVLRTLKRRLQKADYRHEYDRAVNELKISLRTKQVAIALNDKHPAQGTMLIWLGKQFLGQREPWRLEHTGPEGGPLEVTVVYEDQPAKTPRTIDVHATEC